MIKGLKDYIMVLLTLEAMILSMILVLALVIGGPISFIAFLGLERSLWAVPIFLAGVAMVGGLIFSIPIYHYSKDKSESKDGKYAKYFEGERYD